MARPKFLIGIDLGTTNCTLSYALLEESQKDCQIKQFLIPQITQEGTQDECSSLPSFIYFPLSEELKNQSLGVSWDPSRPFCVGSFAQGRGEELPSQVVASAKSWLCHLGIDRRDAKLPLNSEETSRKISPVEACAHLLAHLKEAWNYKMKAPFVEQSVFITVPASFDPSARQLVQEAAQHANYPEIVLLEEPQAAFYAWLQCHAKEWRTHLKVGDCILVVDIGGGTTDFSLIEVEDEQGDLALKRLAVGSHLLLGGDNIDLSLVHLVKNKLEAQGHLIDDWQLQSLIHTCRKAKETLLGESGKKQVDISLLGRGSRLIGGSLKTLMTQEEVKSLVVDGFAPLVSINEQSQYERRLGLKQLGLPYTQDARLTCQLAKFLSMTGEDNSGTMENFKMPTVVLFNGGTMKSGALRNRLLEQLNLWAKYLEKPSVKELPNADYDFAVSRGAVNYGMARAGKAIRIRSGTSCSYFIGIEDAVPAVPGLTPPLKALCIAPFGMEEGTELELNTQEFGLVIGEIATFRFFSHATSKLSDGNEPIMGTVVRKWKEELTELHPIEILLDKTEGDGKIIRVKLHSKVTELGVLELWCKAAEGRKWKLEFDIRN